MKNKLLPNVIIFTLLFFFILIFIYSKDVAESITFSISLWKDNLLPSLFPFFLISDLLLEYGFIDLISNTLGKYMTTIFGLPKEASFAFFTSLFSGFPSGSKYVKDLLDKNLITTEDANHLITFAHYSNPLFITTTVGFYLLNNIRISYIILISHILSNVIIGIIFKKKRKIIINNQSLNNYISNKEKKNFITILMSSIWKSFKILVNMLGIIIFFLIITTLIDKLLNPNEIFKSIICGVLEMTQGVKYVSGLPISIELKSAIIGAIISFSGISVHFQVKSIIEGTNISYKTFLKARILHSILCFILILAIFTVLN